MGNIILLNEGLYKYEIPLKEPSDEKEILNHQYKKSEQFWRTPEIKNVKKLTERERIEHIELHRRRWLEGVWILINGELKYMTGLHYDHLTFNTYNSSKLSYFDDERNIFYFIDKAETDPTCDGAVFIKPRRAKITTILCSLAQRKLLEDFSNYITLQSDTLDKAQKSYMQPIIDSYTRRPEWMREKYYAPNGKKPRKSLELSANVIQEEGDEWMGGKVNIFPTLVKAIDGLEAIMTVIDEFSKIEGVSPYEMYEVARKVIQNFRKQGRIYCASSTGDSKDAVKATMDWHKLIANSNPLKKDKFGKTVSGLWEYFISAIHSQYVPREFTDKFGIVNKEKAEEWVWNEIRKYPEGTKEYIYALYKLPLKKEHALLSSAIGSLFPKIRISARLTILEGMAPDEKPYVRSSLIEKDGKVYREADPSGCWLWAVDPYHSIEKNVDTRNRFYKSDGVFFPYPNPEGAWGYDPINYPKLLTKSNSLSEACGMGHKKHDYYNSGVCDEKVGMMLYRPDNPRDANKEMIKACKYTGYPCMHERSIPHVYEDFRDAGMLPFLMKGEDGIYGISQSNITAKKDGVSMLQSRYAPPKEEGQKDQIATYPFEDGLRSLDNFDINKTTVFDPTMAEIMLEHGLKQIQFTNVTHNDQNNLQKYIQEIIPSRRH